ncbi:MAG: RluA family pseudouridine synthase [Proteobacteria bacterium]|nr:RluA family pseudouridine synthase [Pseudomonadota bacterium]
MSGVALCEVGVADDELRLDRWFQRHYAGLSHSRLQKLLRTGQIRVDGKRVKKGTIRLQVGQTIRVPPLDAEKTGVIAKPSIREGDRAFIRGLVLYQDDAVIAVNKPPGLAVQGGSGTTRHLDGMLGGLVEEGEERPRLVHRLDKDTSGVLLLARSARVADVLGKCFQRGEVQKQYWALTKGVPSPRQGKIDLPLLKMGRMGQERVGVNLDVGKSASTRYMVIETAARQCSWLALFPDTGRTHQLRAHLAAIGHPILGDGKYGGEEAFLEGANLVAKMHLHARQIRMPRPDGKGDFLVQAPLTDHMLATWRFFGFEHNLEITEDLADG